MYTCTEYIYMGSYACSPAILLPGLCCGLHFFFCEQNLEVHNDIIVHYDIIELLL